jgi:hypothetical protein
MKFFGTSRMGRSNGLMIQVLRDVHIVSLCEEFRTFRNVILHFRGQIFQNIVDPEE